MTKLTEEILRAQTCPFTLTTNSGARWDIRVIFLGRDTVVYEDTEGEDSGSVCWLLKNYKLPEPEPKLVTMYECVGSVGEISFRDEKMRYPSLRFREKWSLPDECAVRIPNGRTMQLDISSDPWKWVVK